MMKTLYLFIILSVISFRSFCQYDSIKPQGIYSSNFIIDEIPRTITYYMPLQYGKQESYPLLIVLNDEKSNAKASIKKYGDLIHAKADSAGCIIMYPDAVSGHWHSKTKEGVKDSVNDVGFISIMLEFFVQQYGCDVNQVYLLGMGSGGDMCYRIHCESIYKPALIASINATTDEKSFQSCRNKEAIPVLNIKAETTTKADISKALNFFFAKHDSN